MIRQVRITVVREEIKRREKANEPVLERGVESETYVKNNRNCDELPAISLSESSL